MLKPIMTRLIAAAFRLQGIRRGMAVMEYAILIIIIVLAFLATGSYVNRIFSGYWRSMGDTFGFGKQYEEGVTTCIPLAGDCSEWGDQACCSGLSCNTTTHTCCINLQENCSANPTMCCGPFTCDTTSHVCCLATGSSCTCGGGRRGSYVSPCCPGQSCKPCPRGAPRGAKGTCQT
jgi:hypothetical protein